MICCQAKFQDIPQSGANESFISRVLRKSCCYYWLQEISKSEFWVFSDVPAKFHENYSAVSKVYINQRAQILLSFPQDRKYSKNEIQFPKY
jgi:hypothetical protein